MLTRRSLLRRAVGALAAGTLAGVSRWLPAPKAEDWFVLDEAIPVVVDRPVFFLDWVSIGGSLHKTYESPGCFSEVVIDAPKEKRCATF